MEIVYAGFWRRLVAAILDQIVLVVGRAFVYGALGLMLYAILYLIEIRNNHDAIFRVFAAALSVIDLWLTWIYFAMMESSSLRGTLGKLALGIRVNHRDGGQLTFEQATVRYFAKIISAITLLVGFILAGFSSKKQALHDFIGRSVLTVGRH